MTTTEPRRRGISIYRAADAPDLQDTDLMSSPAMDDDTRAHFGEVIAAGAGAGATVKVLVRQDMDEGGFSLVYLWFKPHYPLPRHTHDTDCLYYVISGTAVMGSQTLRAGDSFFVPCDAPYQYSAGPEGVEVLEIRHGADRFDMKIPGAGAERWRAMLGATEANVDGWRAAGASPMFAANTAGG